MMAIFTYLQSFGRGWQFSDRDATLANYRHAPHSLIGCSGQAWKLVRKE